MNIILVDTREVSGKKVSLTEIRAEHIVKVLRSNVGDNVRVGIVGGGRGTGRILSMSVKYPFEVELELDICEPVSALSPLDLILALPRPIMLKRILAQVTALGVGTIHLIHANRVEKSFWSAGILCEKEYRVHLLHGLEQAVDTRLPEIRLHKRFKPFVEDYLPSSLAGYDSRILAHPAGDSRLVDLIPGSSGRVVLAIGPEGGWVDYEVRKFREQGFGVCSMGERILKVDTAVVALHSGIMALREVVTASRLKKNQFPGSLNGDCSQ